jgi:transcriptional regulator with XRE-family HTH domain
MIEETDGMPGNGLAKLIKRRRAELNMTLRDVAAAAGVNNKGISEIETGKVSNSKVLMLFGLSVALQTSFEEICRAALVDAQARSRKSKKGETG